MTLKVTMALFCVISENSGSFRAHCIKVHVRYLISWWVLVRLWNQPMALHSIAHISNKRLCCCRRTARCAAWYEILSTVAQKEWQQDRYIYAPQS